MTRVLVVDDEPQILRALRINLRVRDYDVHVAATGAEALEVAGRYPPDLVILDLGLPDLDGVEVIQGLRGWTKAPIIVLSGRADSVDKVEALDAGADDYITKPFGVEELLARMRAAVRRTGAVEDLPRIQLGHLVVDLAAKRVTRQAAVPAGGGDQAGADPAGAGSGRAQADDIRLTPTEWHLLEVLLRNPGKLLSRNQLLTEVWGPGYADATGNLRLYMAQLRRKLEPDPARPRWLITEPGMGYRYQPSPDRTRRPGDAGPPGRAYQGKGWPSRVRVPVGPPLGMVTAQMTLAAAWASERPSGLRSLAGQPGQTALTRMPSLASSAASSRVRALSPALETPYAGEPPVITAIEPPSLLTLTILGRVLERSIGSSE